MNLKTELSKNKIKLLEDAGVNIKDKDYSSEELRQCEVQVEDFIMNHSSKNGDVSKYGMEYSELLNDLIKYQEI